VSPRGGETVGEHGEFAEIPVDARLEKQPSRIEPGAIVVIAWALTVLGLVMIASTTMPLDAGGLGRAWYRAPFVRQAMFLAGGLVAMAAVQRLAGPLLFRSARRRATVVLGLLAIVVALLLAVYLPGIADAQRGSRRWIQVGPAPWGLGFQPSEFAKPVMVLFAAWWLSRTECDVTSVRRGVAVPALMLAAVVGLVGAADFGTSGLFAVVAGLMLLAAGCRLRHVGGLALAGGAGLAALLVTSEYRMRRITAFIDPWADPLGSGFHPIQSLRTIASGGWLGTGLGNGMQKHGYLPEGSTDFLFSNICEETGIIGGLLVIAAYVSLVGLGIVVVRSARSSFERLTAFGVVVMIGVQAAMHVAVATVSAPTKGISLPFVSAGGSGLLTAWASVGLLRAIAMRASRRDAALIRDEVRSAPRLAVGG
jgi:cell division protein FtsW